MGGDIKLGDDERQLLFAATRMNSVTPPPTLADLSWEIYGDHGHESQVQSGMRRLQKKLPEGIRLHEEEGRAYFNFSDFYTRGLDGLFEVERKEPEFYMYLTPPRGGIGTWLFDDYLALGINLFLRQNYPVIAGKKSSDQRLIKSLDGIVMMGGMAAEVPQFNNTSDISIFSIKLLNSFQNGSMSLDRKEEEERTLDAVANANLPEDVKRDFRKKVSGIILNPLEAAAYTSSVLETMLKGYDGPVFVQPGAEDDRNEKHIRTGILKRITDASQEYRRMEGRINGLYDEAERAHVKRVLALHLLDEIQAAENYIYGNNDMLIKAYNIDNRFHDDWEDTTNVNLIKNRMRNDPTEKRSRRAFEYLFTKFKKEHIEGLKGDYDWKKEYFEGVPQDLVAKIKKHETKGFGRQVIQQFDLIRTYLGMGWRLQIPENRIHGTDAVLASNESKRVELTGELEGLRDTLYALGWFNPDKLVSKKDPRDVAMIELLVQHQLKEYFAIALENVHGTVLGKGQNLFRINNTTFYTRINVDDQARPADLRDKVLMAMIGDWNQKHEYVPDVLLVGPNPHGTLIGVERKHGQEKSQTPKFKLERDAESAFVFALGSLYTTEVVSRFQRSKMSAPPGFPRDFTTYGHLLFDFIDVDNLHHTYAISANDIRQLAIDHINQVMKKEEDRYSDGFFILRADDSHNGMAHDPLQIPGNWYVDAMLSYAMNRLIPALGVPTVTTASEIYDGRQNFKRFDSGFNDHGFSEKQVRVAKEAIRKTYDRKTADSMVDALDLMDKRARQATNLNEQAEEFLNSLYVPLFKAIARAGEGHSIYMPKSDHGARTQTTVQEEPRDIQQMFRLVIEKSPTGLVSVADAINPSRTSSASLMGFVEGELPDGRPIYAAHKMEIDGKAHLRRGRLPSIGLAAHRHHRYTILSGDTWFDVAPGYAETYPHINDAGLTLSNQSIAGLIIPRMDSPFRQSPSIINGGIETIIHNQPAYQNMVEMRRTILEHVPVAR
ncbi:MAG: hypothetical protein HGA85_03125 [Nanoarchaeota archaeon]|nr:hypothetical protein [Nanoarchaeota archaeon]